MSYNDPNRQGKDQGKSQSYGDQTGQKSGTETYSKSQEPGDRGKTQSLKDPWKKQLQDVNLEDTLESKPGKSSERTKQSKGSKYGSGKRSKKENENYTQEEQENEGYDEEGENGESGRNGEAGRGGFVKSTKKAIKYLEEQIADMDKTTMAKYAAVGALLLVGMRKTNLLGGLLLTAAAGWLTKSIVEEGFELVDEEGEQEDEGETATA